jgi:hypothetical protein
MGAFRLSCHVTRSVTVRARLDSRWVQKEVAARDGCVHFENAGDGGAGPIGRGGTFTPHLFRVRRFGVERVALRNLSRRSHGDSNARSVPRQGRTKIIHGARETMELAATESKIHRYRRNDHGRARKISPEL